MRRHLALLVPALLVPVAAFAHDPFDMVFIPPFFVPILVLLTVWAWDASIRGKLLSIIAVALASAAALGLNVAILDQRTRIDPNSVFPAMLLAPLLVPAIVWLACWRRTRRGRPHDESP
jgi:hypothetical protein